MANPYPKAPAPPVEMEQANAEHGVQMGLIKAARDALNPGDGNLAELVAHLYDYTEMHFMSEALLMRMTARPNYGAHLAEHERLLSDLEEIRSLVEEGRHGDAGERLRSHEKDVLDHICSWDRSI